VLAMTSGSSEERPPFGNRPGSLFFQRFDGGGKPTIKGGGKKRGRAAEGPNPGGLAGETIERLRTLLPPPGGAVNMKKLGRGGRALIHFAKKTIFECRRVGFRTAGRGGGEKPSTDVQVETQMLQVPPEGGARRRQRRGPF